MRPTDPLSIPTAHVVAVLASKRQPGHWITVEAVERGRRLQRGIWNAVLGAALTLAAIGVWAAAMALWSA